MDELKKIQLNDEPKQTSDELQSRGGRLRLSPTGNNSGKEYNTSSNIIATGEYTSGNYKWTVSVSALVTIDVKYVWDNEYHEYFFERAIVSVSNIYANFAGTTQGSVASGKTYSSLAYSPSGAGGSGGEDQTSIMPVIVSAGSYPLKGFYTIYDNEGNPKEQGKLETFNAALSLRIEYGCSPYVGVIGISADLV